LLQGCSIEQSLEFANAIGAMVVQVSGGNEGLPYLEEVEGFLGKRQMVER
jgi:2-dehydro-3-deoxygluconokinase